MNERKPNDAPPIAERPPTLDWNAPPKAPTRDFLGGFNLEWPWDLEEAVAKFSAAVQQGAFLAWEAAVCVEQGVPVTAAQRAGIERLHRVAADEADEKTPPLRDQPRPGEPWYAILNKIVPHLLVEPLQTAEVYEDVQYDGWFNLATCLQEHGQGLSLPPGIASTLDVVPVDLRHKLWVQACCAELAGLGQADDMTLENEDEQFRVYRFIHRLPTCRESVAFLGLTLDSLLSRVILPARDRPVFVRMMQEKLGVRSPAERLAEYL